MKIEVSIDPLPQSRPRFTNGRCYETARISAYKKEVGMAAKVAMKGKPPITDPLSVKLRCFRKFKITSRRYGDCDNLLKAVLDALNGIIFLDDSQVTLAQVEKLQGTPKIELEIKKVLPEGGGTKERLMTAK